MIRFLCALLLAAGTVGSAAGQFTMIGDAQPMNGDCIMLTPDVQFREGIAYFNTRLDLQDYFQIEFDIYLGDKDDLGADGITFVLHNDPRGFDAFGTWGECIGYGRWSPAYGTSITPSVAVEFDTYQNPRQLDPPGDHVAFLENGISQHETYWNGGNTALNLEDDQMHNFRFRWNPDERQITVLLDGEIVYQGRRDLIGDVFEGQTSVIWGFTASTGRKHNLQYFCLRRLARR